MLLPCLWTRLLGGLIMNSIIEAQEDFRFGCLLTTRTHFQPKTTICLRDWIWYFNGEEKILCFVRGTHYEKGILLAPHDKIKSINPKTNGILGANDYVSWENLKGNVYEEVSDL